MKIIFDIRRSTGGRTYGASLNFQSFEMVKNETTGKIIKVVNGLRTINGIPAPMLNNIFNEFNKSGELTGVNLTNLNFLLNRKGTSVEKMNNETFILT